MKTKKLLSILVLALFSLCQFVNADAPSWKWVKWSDGTQTTATSACTDASGNLYATGTFNTSTKFDGQELTTNGNGAFIVKYTAAGEVSWTRKIKNPGWAAIEAKSIAIDPEGNLYVTGPYSGTIELDTKTLTGGGHYLAKYSNDGTIQWAVNTKGSNAVAANANGIFVGGGKIIQKFDNSGTESWTITGVPSNTGYTNFFSVALNSSGNLIAAGDIDDKWTFGSTIVTGGYQNIIVMEISSAGTVTWAKTFGANANGGDHAQHITLDASNNIIMTGKVGGASNFDAVSLGSKAGYLVKLNSAGVAQWGTLLTSSTTIYGDGGLFVATDALGAMYVTGGCGSGVLGDGGSVTYVKSMTGNNAYILKFNATGTFESALTSKELKSPYINNNRGMALASSTAGVYFAGVCAPNSEWGSLTTPRYGSVFAKIVDGTIQGIKDSKYKMETVSVYPNPSAGSFTLELGNSELSLKSTNIFIVNTMGEIVYKKNVEEQSSTINLESTKGIYFLQLRTEGGMITKKLVIE